ncbi:VOC family protein [Maribellus comscasis]|uniref:VOC family protein n=1 Tax=Maribellus comscasis TaxID=2681766 RepID=A0A6I6JQ47_9BACT|nr:VOC family protein [Maribellus comscasis]QGY43130.1 VOC family protein [Maribellus comscasis]
MKPRLNIVTLGVKNLQESRAFYKNAFGWELANGSDENIVFFNHGGIVLALYPLDKLAEDAGITAERSGFSGVTLAINQDSKEALIETFNKAVENGAKILVEPRETFWGGFDAYFADPDGHPWEIAWAPFWKFDEQGSLFLG